MYICFVFFVANSTPQNHDSSLKGQLQSEDFAIERNPARDIPDP